MFAKNEAAGKKDEFLEQAKTARQERANERRRQMAAICLQRHTRGYLARVRFKRNIRNEVDTLFQEDVTAERAKTPALEIFKALRKFFMIMNEEEDRLRFKRVCKYLISSMDVENIKLCYISVALNKEHAVQWIVQLKTVLWQCCLYLQKLKPEDPTDAKLIALYLHTLVIFTSITTWRPLVGKNDALRSVMLQLCTSVLSYLVSKGLYQVIQSILKRGLVRTTPCLKHAPFLACINMALRPLTSDQISDHLQTLFLIHILSVPALFHHMATIAPECVSLFSSHGIFLKCLNLLSTEQNSRIVFNALEGSYTLCLLGNIVELSNLEREVLEGNILDFTNVLIRLMESCQKYVVSKQSNLSHWHPVLGWFSQKVDHNLHECLPFVKSQLQLLWGAPLLQVMFSPLFQAVTKPLSPQSDTVCNGSTSEAGSGNSSKHSSNVANSTLSMVHEAIVTASHGRAPSFLRKAIEKASSKSASVKYRKLGSPETTTVAVVCSLYQMALSTFTQLRLDILTGLCYQDILLPHLWQFLASFGPGHGLKAFLDLLSQNTKTTAPEFQMLMLFCDCMTHLVTILDDLELYEQQKPFCLEDLVSLTLFLNYLIFKMIWGSLIDLKFIQKNQFFNSVHTLLMLLYQRDCRRKYTPDDHWLIKEIRPSSFMNDLDKGKKAAQILLQKVPHIIPHRERVLLFRKYIANEKTVLGVTESACASPQSTLITIHRTRIVEDGYRQLALLPAQALKGVIRVKFINEQGLDEAGIDQDGVFKEFLEETIQRVFNPSLNLFKVTSEERLYPSPTSHVHENHLQLFEFVGRMLGKAVYEGIVVDVPFASFFLSQVLGHQHSALYSSIDELPSLDPDLYKSLTYIKHYNGDIQDLDLTFSYDDDYMGEVVTHELITGGKAVPATNENKISYIHLMAHFRMHVQIRDQTAAFIRGFRSIINPEWLAMFSTPELQRLISGDTVEIDLQDLRKNTHYYGGFHDNHRVICWLWDILEKDFSPHERSLFLKFVTSCSKPPLLGFAHLEPPFSIRCVEVSDDQDTGDTVGSVLRGFFAIQRKDPINRLPTSSTCFNLLKLPNYQKKSTLREKMRYAITSNTGFELS